MDHFEADGTWWLPESPDNFRIGTLALDAEGFTLTVEGSIEPDTDPGIMVGMPEVKVTPVIHGRQRTGEKVTLLHAEGANFTGPHAGQSDYRVRSALINRHVEEDLFSAARIEFDCLEEWTSPPSLTSMEDGKVDYVVHFGGQDIGAGTVGSTAINLRAEATGTISTRSVDVERNVALVLTFEPATVSELIDRWVRPLQDLFILSTGRPVRLTNIHLRPPEFESYARLVFEAVQAEATRKFSWGSMHGYAAPTLLTLGTCKLSFDELMRAWFALRDRVREVLVLLHAPYYEKSMFNEHRYSVTFQSAEALSHVLGYSGREKSRPQHSARVRAIIKAARESGVDNEDIEWAERVLRSRNDKPLSAQIHDLISSTPIIGDVVLTSVPNFGSVASAARTGVSHGGAEISLGAPGRHWMLEVIQYVVRARLLMELGLDREEIGERAAGRAGFTHALAKLRIEIEKLS